MAISNPRIYFVVLLLLGGAVVQGVEGAERRDRTKTRERSVEGRKFDEGFMRRLAESNRGWYRRLNELPKSDTKG